ncbi:MAG: aspartate ammonia-lyase, partial [Bacilli bacterium]|nr:aspartate ammonia-lyase [Bacilli bacterium]
MRVEHDLLGQMEVPDNVYYGIHTLRAVHNFQISGKKIGSIPNLIYGIVVVKKATALTNNELKVLDDKRCKAIVDACDLIIDKIKNEPEWILENFPIDVFQGGAGTSTNMNANEVIANVALEIIGEKKGHYDIIHPNDHVNMSQSTNDAYPTAVRIALVLGANTILKHIKELHDAFERKEIEFKDVYKMGRTQLQDAVPMTLGQEFSAYKELMVEESIFIEKMTSLLHEINLGATAIGTGTNTPQGFAKKIAEVLSNITGFEEISS